MSGTVLHLKFKCKIKKKKQRFWYFNNMLALFYI